MTQQRRFPEHPRRNPDNAYRAVGDDGGLVVVPRDSKVEVLNPVASKIYSMLDGKNSQEQIISAVVDEFDVTEEEARKDLQTFLEELEGKNMLAASGDPAPSQEMRG